MVDHPSRKLAVIIHADVEGSTTLVQRNETLAHQRIQAAFQLFSETIGAYGGIAREIRGDALVAEFERGSDAVSAALSFQADQAHHNSGLHDDLIPIVRIGIAMGEVIVADNTVTGSGVVLAQRVEQLASPGGVCITAALHESLPRQMPFDLADLGDQVLKGFDDPVHVYRVELSSGSSIPSPQRQYQRKTSQNLWNGMVAFAIAVVLAVGIAYWFKSTAPEKEPASIERMAFQLPDKPSIAVLPFTNLSDDTQQEYFVDGMTEDLITDISKLSGLFVIARNSVFTYKGKAVKVRQVAEELGVRYVMEGSARRVGNQVRVNAQLIDATTGGHIWAERYDGSLDDVFSMQDKIIKNIVAALSVTLGGQENGSLFQSETNNPDAYDAFLRGWERYRRNTPADYREAVSYFELAIELDPEYTRAHSALAAVYWNSAWRYWVDIFGLSAPEVSELARIYLKRAMNAPSALTHQIASERAAYFDGRPDKALIEAETAIALDANDPAGHLAMANALLKANRPNEAEASMQRAMRLDPQHPGSYFTRLGRTQFALGQYKDAADSLKLATENNPQDDRAFVFLAAAYGHLGRTEDTRVAIENVNRLRRERRWGEITLQDIGFWKWIGDRQTLREGLTLAGVKSGVGWYSRVKRTADVTEVRGATKISAEKAFRLYERGAVFVDISREFSQGHVPGAHNLVWLRNRLNLNPREFNEIRLLELLNKSQEVVIYHLQGLEDAAFASAYAVEYGFQKVYYFEEGLDGWKKAGYPVLKGSE